MSLFCFLIDAHRGWSLFSIFAKSIGHCKMEYSDLAFFRYTCQMPNAMMIAIRTFEGKEIIGNRDESSVKFSR